MEGVIREVQRTLSLASSHFLFPSIIEQIMRRTLYYTNCLFFNRLVGKRELCCSTIGYVAHVLSLTLSSDDRC